MSGSKPKLRSSLSIAIYEGVYADGPLTRDEIVGRFWLRVPAEHAIRQAERSRRRCRPARAGRGDWTPPETRSKGTFDSLDTQRIGARAIIVDKVQTLVKQGYLVRTPDDSFAARNGHV